MTLRQFLGVLAALAACAVTAPSAQSSGECGYLWIGGNGLGDRVFGWAMTSPYYGRCFGEGVPEGLQIFAAVQVVSPWGASASDSDEGYDGAYAEAEAPLQPGEAGHAQVYGEGAICSYACLEVYQDSMAFPVSGPPPPAPDPPAISFSPTPPVTVEYGAGDVVFTASVSPAGQGWEEQLYWVGDGEATGNPLQRSFSSTAVGTWTATAVIAGQTEASVSVTVVPTISLDPVDVTVPYDDEGEVVITATVQPAEAGSQLVWSGAGWTPPANNLLRIVSTDAVGNFVAFASVPQAQTRQATVRVVPPALCGDERDVIIQEYLTHQVNFVPTCDDFSNGGDTDNFSWAELNGYFSGGNETRHYPWGIVRQVLKAGLEATRANYNRGGIRLTSGYRCPAGNSAAGSKAPQTSLHMHGRAADMKSAAHTWTEAEFALLREAARLTNNAVELSNWDDYPDHHLHAAW
jgi:hypothetical protein